MKQCSKCKELKEETEFYRYGMYLQSYCKICQKVWNKEYGKRYIEKHRINQRRYYHEHSKIQNEFSRKYHKEHKESGRKYSSKRYKEHREDVIETNRKSRLKRKYNLSVEDYDKLLDKQNGVCAICGAAQSKRLAIDHNHITGKVRGLLCSKCNTVLGLLKDSTIILQEAINYLERTEKNDVSEVSE